MSKALVITDDLLLSRIIEIRGQKVMVDRDLADMYGVTTKRLNEQVKRNKKRFPVEFMFPLSQDEKKEVVAKCDHLRTMKYSPNLPYVFTEHGAVMLASVLNSEKAIEVNVRIVKLFNATRLILHQHNDLLLKLEQLDRKIILLSHDVKMHDGEIESVFELINEIRTERNASKKVTVVEGFIKKR